jgi:hypothetical protein
MLGEQRCRKGVDDMAASIQVEPLGDHEYLVTFPVAGEQVRSRFRATEETLGKLGSVAADESRVIAETAAYLAEHQQVSDIPPMVDLYDVEAAYGGDYLYVLAGHLT